MLYLDMRTIHERVSGINKPQKMSGEVEKVQDKDTPRKEEKTERPSSVDPTKVFIMHTSLTVISHQNASKI